MSTRHNIIVMVCAIALGAIGFFIQQTDATSYADGTLLTSPQYTSVYQMENGTRRPFVNDRVYKTWYANFTTVQKISDKEMQTIDLGNPMPIKTNTLLLKFPVDPKIYAVTNDEYLQHIPDVDTAIALYGKNWEQKIIELPEIYSLFYTKGSALENKKPSPSTAQYSTQQLEYPVTDLHNLFVEYIPTLSKISKNNLNPKGQFIIKDGRTLPQYYYNGTAYITSYNIYEWIDDYTSVDILSQSDFDSLYNKEDHFVCQRAGKLIRFKIPGSANGSNNYLGEYDKNELLYYVGNNCILHKVPSMEWVKKWYGVYSDEFHPEKPTKWTIGYDARDKAQWQLEFKIGTPFTESSTPVGMTAQDDHGDIWYIDTDGKRLVTDEGMKNNHFFKHLLLNIVDIPLSPKGNLIKNEAFLPVVGLKNSYN